MNIKKVTDPEFKAYGRVVKGYDCRELLEAMEKTPLLEDVIYVASVKELEELPVAKQMEKNLYGQMPSQVGYEINVAVTDLVLLIGKQQDIKEDYTYDTGLVEAFLVPRGTVIEVYATTLHYAPCHVEDGGFRCVVVLPKDTNTDMEPVEEIFPEDKLLFAKNKWLIGHEEGGLPENAWIGLKGENVSI